MSIGRGNTTTALGFETRTGGCIAKDGEGRGDPEEWLETQTSRHFAQS
jgi:hypothetical protein